MNSHKKLNQKYNSDDNMHKYSYNGTFRKKDIKATYLYWWNILELYNYYYNENYN